MIGYAVGSLPIGYLVAHAASGIDLRRVGSGNVGAANVAVLILCRHRGNIVRLGSRTERALGT